MSMMVGPSPSRIKIGLPPTALNARTGELTPPGMSWRALRNAASESPRVFLLRSAMKIGRENRRAILDRAGGEGNAGQSARSVSSDQAFRREVRHRWTQIHTDK